jgi:hypothetical protein
MFEGDFTDICTQNFRLCQWGAERSVAHAQTWEWGPPLAKAEICIRTHLGWNKDIEDKGMHLFKWLMVNFKVEKNINRLKWIFCSIFKVLDSYKSTTPNFENLLFLSLAYFFSIRNFPVPQMQTLWTLLKFWFEYKYRGKLLSDRLKSCQVVYR